MQDQDMLKAVLLCYEVAKNVFVAFSIGWLLADLLEFLRILRFGKGYYWVFREGQDRTKAVSAFLNEKSHGFTNFGIKFCVGGSFVPAVSAFYESMVIRVVLFLIGAVFVFYGLLINSGSGILVGANRE